MHSSGFKEFGEEKVRVSEIQYCYRMIVRSAFDLILKFSWVSTESESESEG